MTYGNKIIGIFLCLFAFFLVGCEKNENWYFELYDSYTIQSREGNVKLYKENHLISISDFDYKIESFKYNSDVVCLKLSNKTYYMIYYVDSSVYGPFDLESLNESTNTLSMSFENDFTEVSKVEGRVYE